MSESSLSGERDAFSAARRRLADEARQRLALRILFNGDLDEMIGEDAQSKARTCCRLKRLIERERLKGQRGHWSYDLNRHIGLKQALDRLKATMQQG